MGDPRGFLKRRRQHSTYRQVCERVQDYENVAVMRPENISQEQAGRCMDCGVPFCHWGCPIANYIPEWNEAMHNSDWSKAYTLLDATNNMPEITGRVCPALCEYACVLGKNDDAVTVRDNELAVIEYAFSNGLVKPQPPKKRTGRKIAVIGSGPAGLSCAVQLNKAGHNVTVFERDKKIGGILRYGIPDFKLEKNLIDRRLNLWQAEGIQFNTGIEIGKDYKADKLLKEFDAVSLAFGSRIPRDIDIKGRNLKGIYFAMDYLTQANKKVSNETIASSNIIDVKGKRVVVIGGGDTGSDCVGTANRQGASCVVQIEVMPMPPEERSAVHPWPTYPLLLKTTSSHEEGCQRYWSILTKEFFGSNKKVKGLSCVQVEFSPGSKGKPPCIKEIPKSRFDIEADIILLAVGFTGPEGGGLLDALGVQCNERGNIKTDENFMSSKEKIFACGDARRGQSLVVWAVAEGRQCAHEIDRYLMGESDLPAIYGDIKI